MGEQCELAYKCAYFRQYRDSKDLIHRRLVWVYCEGNKLKDCRRREYRKVHGYPPPDFLLPDGTVEKRVAVH